MNIKQIPAALASVLDAVYNALTPEQQAYTTRENVLAVLGATALIQPVGDQVVDPIASIIRFNVDAGNTTDTLNVRQSALYVGLQVEELAEKLDAIGLVSTAKVFDSIATTLKRGDHDVTVAHALADPKARAAMLDADCDLMVVSVGAAISQGADFPGAIRDVCASNDSKRDHDGMLKKDANGKIIKGAGYFAADMFPFIRREAQQ